MKHVGRFTTLLVALAIGLLAGYASAQGPADVSGTWTGSTARGAATVTLVLKQEGKKVTGTISGIGTGDGPIEGTIDGNTIRLRQTQGSGSTPTLNVKGDQITGIVGSGDSVNLRRTK